MPTFTDTELQKKFCEGFTFFPFKSLEQHDTLIYKRYGGKENLEQLLAWHNSEHDASHYRIKLSKKLKHNDLPAATRLLEALREMSVWCGKRSFAAKLRSSGKKFSAGIVKYQQLLTVFHEHTLQPLAAMLADKYKSTSIEYMGEMINEIGIFVRDTDDVYESLKTSADEKQDIFSDADRENFLKLVSLMQSFRAHQARSTELLNAWKNRQIMHDNYRSMN